MPSWWETALHSVTTELTDTAAPDLDISVLGSLLEKLEIRSLSDCLLDRGLHMHFPPSILAICQSSPNNRRLDTSKHDNRTGYHPHPFLGMYNCVERIRDWWYISCCHRRWEILIFLISGMIIYRLWKVVGHQRDGPTRDFKFVMRVFIESGALYFLVTIPHFVVWWTHTGPSSAAILVVGWIVRQS